MKCLRVSSIVLSGLIFFWAVSLAPAAQQNSSDLRPGRGQNNQREQGATNQRVQSDQQSRQSNELSAWQFIEDFDENGDGVLQREELPRKMRDQIGQLDRDGDNRLTADELHRHGKRAMRRHAGPAEVVYIWITDADSGHLSLNDLQQAYDSLQEIDEDGNGQLSRNELRQRRQELFARWAGTVTDRIDENGDSRISPSEAQNTFLLPMFDRLDANSDGAISKQELTQCIASGMHRSGQLEMRTGSRQDSQAEDDRSQRSERSRQDYQSRDNRQQGNRQQNDGPERSL